MRRVLLILTCLISALLLGACGKGNNPAAVRQTLSNYALALSHVDGKLGCAQMTGNEQKNWLKSVQAFAPGVYVPNCVYAFDLFASSGIATSLNDSKRAIASTPIHFDDAIHARADILGFTLHFVLQKHGGWLIDSATEESPTTPERPGGQTENI